MSSLPSPPFARDLARPVVCSRAYPSARFGRRAPRDGARARLWLRFGMRCVALALVCATAAPARIRAQEAAHEAEAPRAAQEAEAPRAAPEPDAPEPSPTHTEIRPPVWLHAGAAPWPSDAVGTAPALVQVLVTVDASGAITEVAPDPSAPADPVFVDAALDFVRKQQFAPAVRGGEPVPSRVGLAVRFVPPSQPAAPAITAHAGSSAPTSPPAPVAAPPSATPSSGYGASAHVAGSPGPALTAASDVRVEVGALHGVPRQDAAELLTLAPGVVLTNHAGEGHAPAVFLRGFSAGEGQDLEVRVAGIPINEPSNAHGHGYADTHFVVPELVRSVRVLEGPFDLRQGDFAAAGSAELELAAPEAGMRAQLGVGSFGRRRVLLAWSPSGSSRETFAAVDLVEGDGFGPNRAHGNVRALGQFHGRAHHIDYRVLVASHALRFDSAGVVRKDAVDSGAVRCGGSSAPAFYCFMDPNQGGQASRHLVSLRIGQRRPGAEWSQQLTFMLRESRFRENFTGAALDARGDGLDQQTNTTTFTARGHYRAKTTLGGRPQALELGYEGRYDTGDSRMWRVRRTGQVPYDVVFDNELSLTRVSVFALAELNMARWVNAQLGARADTFGYAILDRDQESADRVGERVPMQRVNAWGTNYQPRATLTLGPVVGLSWVNSVGIGSRSSDAAALSEGEQAPFTRIWAGESGVVAKHRWPLGTAEARSAFFYAHVDRDLLFDETRGRNVPIGATNRYGAYTHLRAQVGSRFDSIASFTWAEAHAPEDGKSVGFGSGPRLPFVPRFVARGDAAVSESVTSRWGLVHLRGGMGTSWVGPRPLPLDTLSESIFTLDASVRARFRFMELTFSATNLTDRQNRSAEYFYASDFATGGAVQRRQRHFSAAPPRQFMLTFALVFDPAPASEEEP